MGERVMLIARSEAAMKFNVAETKFLLEEKNNQQLKFIQKQMQQDVNEKNKTKILAAQKKQMEAEEAMEQARHAMKKAKQFMDDERQKAVAAQADMQLQLQQVQEQEQEKLNTLELSKNNEIMKVRKNAMAEQKNLIDRITNVNVD